MQPGQGVTSATQRASGSLATHRGEKGGMSKIAPPHGPGTSLLLGSVKTSLHRILAHGTSLATLFRTSHKERADNIRLKAGSREPK